MHPWRSFERNEQTKRDEKDWYLPSMFVRLVSVNQQRQCPSRPSPSTSATFALLSLFPVSQLLLLQASHQGRRTHNPRHIARYYELCFETGTPESERVTAVQTWRTASRYSAQLTHIYTHTHTGARERRVTEDATDIPIPR